MRRSQLDYELPLVITPTRKRQGAAEPGLPESVLEFLNLKDKSHLDTKYRQALGKGLDTLPAVKSSCSNRRQDIEPPSYVEAEWSDPTLKRSQTMPNLKSGMLSRSPSSKSKLRPVDWIPGTADPAPRPTLDRKSTSMSSFIQRNEQRRAIRTSQQQRSAGPELEQRPDTSVNASLLDLSEQDRSHWDDARSVMVYNSITRRMVRRTAATRKHQSGLRELLPLSWPLTVDEEAAAKHFDGRFAKRKYRADTLLHSVNDQPSSHALRLRFTAAIYEVTSNKYYVNEPLHLQSMTPARPRVSKAKPFDLRTSIWAPRAKWADSLDFYDTNAVELARHELDTRVLIEMGLTELIVRYDEDQALDVNGDGIPDEVRPLPTRSSTAFASYHLPSRSLCTRTRLFTRQRAPNERRRLSSRPLLTVLAPYTCR